MKKREMAPKLTNEDALSIISGEMDRIISEKAPPVWRLEQWKKLAKATLVRVFYNDKIDAIRVSDEFPDNQTRLRAMENISKLAGDYAGSMVKGSFEGANGESVTFECYFGGKEAEEEDSGE